MVMFTDLQVVQKGKIMMKPKSNSGRTSGFIIDSREKEISLTFSMDDNLATALFLQCFWIESFCLYGLNDKLYYNLLTWEVILQNNI